MSRPLIDRMAEALKPFAQVAAVYEGTKAGDSVYPMLNVSRLRDAVSALAEYRNRPPEISQETARELLANLKIVTEPERKVGYVGDPYAKWPKLRKLVSLIARAEAELKGKS